MFDRFARWLERKGKLGIDRGIAPTDGAFVVDATPLDTGHRARGLGRYVDGLLSGFRTLGDARHAPDALRPLRMGGDWARLEPDDSEPEMAGSDTTADVGEWQLRRPPFPNTREAYLYHWLLNEWRLDAELEQSGCRLFHSTQPWAIPVSPYFRTVKTCHDVIRLMFPEQYLEGNLLWRAYYWWMNRRERWQCCDRIIAISRATKRALCDHLDVRPERISVVHNGIDHDQFQPVDDPDRLRDVRERHDLPERFVLYLGGYDFRKNIDVLVEAMPRLPGDVDLLLAGGMSEARRDALTRLAERHGVESRLCFPGYIDDADVPPLYAAAEVFAYPSLAEGFGLRILETMAMGCPIVASDRTSIPEVLGDAGLLVDPEAPTAIAEGLNRMLADETFRLACIERGLERVQTFSWRRCAEETLEVYRNVLVEP